MLNSRSVIRCCFLFVSLFFLKFCSLKRKLTWFWIKWTCAVILFCLLAESCVLLLSLSGCWGSLCVVCGITVCLQGLPPCVQGRNLGTRRFLPVLSWRLCCCCHTFYSYTCSKHHSALFLLLFEHLGKIVCTISMPPLPCCRLVCPFFSSLAWLTDFFFFFNLTFF